MFKQQLSPRSVHPYQTTVIPRNDQQFTSATQHRTKYPWAEEAAEMYQFTTDSSASDPAYNVSDIFMLFIVPIYPYKGLPEMYTIAAVVIKN